MNGDMFRIPGMKAFGEYSMCSRNLRGSDAVHNE